MCSFFTISLSFCAIFKDAKRKDRIQDVCHRLDMWIVSVIFCFFANISKYSMYKSKRRININNIIIKIINEGLEVRIIKGISKIISVLKTRKIILRIEF